ncbi:MAG: hypothetical protein Ct9H90mP2_09280 [Dehalococcoidia bacterium]|nr:MAG: hypothetical protein Ct9H90mP2_09280 [Dehalococcoidia bacterium]
MIDAKIGMAPFKIPMFNQSGIAARTDWLIQDNKTGVIMLTATKTNGKKGRVFSCITKDGGKKIRILILWVKEFPEGYDIMPSSIQLKNGNILTAIRRRVLIEKFLD